jgi:hypothetical protein
MDLVNLALCLKFQMQLPMSVLLLSKLVSLDSKLTLLTEVVLHVFNQKCPMKLPMSASL